MMKGNASDTVVLLALQEHQSRGEALHWPQGKASLAMKCGLGISRIASIVDRLTEAGLVTATDGYLIVNRRGKDFLAARAGHHG